MYESRVKFLWCWFQKRRKDILTFINPVKDLENKEMFLLTHIFKQRVCLYC